MVKQRAPKPSDPSRGRGTVPPGGASGKRSIPRQGRPAPGPMTGGMGKPTRPIAPRPPKK